MIAPTPCKDGGGLDEAERNAGVCEWRANAVGSPEPPSLREMFSVPPGGELQQQGSFSHLRTWADSGPPCSTRCAHQERGPALACCCIVCELIICERPGRQRHNPSTSSSQPVLCGLGDPGHMRLAAHRCSIGPASLRHQQPSLPHSGTAAAATTAAAAAAAAAPRRARAVRVRATADDGNEKVGGTAEGACLLSSQPAVHREIERSVCTPDCTPVAPLPSPCCAAAVPAGPQCVGTQARLVPTMVDPGHRQRSGGWRVGSQQRLVRRDGGGSGPGGRLVVALPGHLPSAV